MSTTTLSSKFQIVIPKEIRDQMGWGAGQKLQAIAMNGRVELVAERPIGELRGFLSGISSEVPRDEDRV
jgi:AbrB family looped-hinge helix DNA binding protein